MEAASPLPGIFPKSSNMCVLTKGRCLSGECARNSGPWISQSHMASSHASWTAANPVRSRLPWKEKTSALDLSSQEVATRDRRFGFECRHDHSDRCHRPEHLHRTRPPKDLLHYPCLCPLCHRQL